MERRVANAFPGPPPPVPYYHNNYNHHHPHHHNPRPIHPPPPHHHVAAGGFHSYPHNDSRDQRFNQPHFDPYAGQQQNIIVDHNTAPPFPPSNGFSPSRGSLRKRRSQSATGLSPDTADITIAKLYIAPVPKTANEDDVRQVFEKHGNVTEIILPKDKMTGERAGYCFVKYKMIEEGNAAITALTDQYTFPGEICPVKVRFADADRERIGFPTAQVPDKLYVRCLNKQTTKAEVHEVFARYGVIEDIFMAVDEMKFSRVTEDNGPKQTIMTVLEKLPGKNLGHMIYMDYEGHAFVQFSRRDMALAAIKGLNGVYTMRGSDQPLTVRFADPKKPRLGEARSIFNTPPAMQQFDPNWHPQHPQWGNKEPAAPRVFKHHDSASQPNHFSQQNSQAVSEIHTPQHQNNPPQNFEKHQKSETTSVETGSNGQKKISSDSNALPEDRNRVSTECDWSEHTCPDGNKYYFHCITCESTWEKPEEYSMFERWFEEQTKLQDKKTRFTSVKQSEPTATRLVVETTCS